MSKMNQVPKVKTISHHELTEYMYYESGDFQTILKVDSLNKTLCFYDRVPGESVDSLKPLNWTTPVFDQYDKIIDCVAPGAYTFDVVVYNGHQLYIVDLLACSGANIEMFTYTDRLAKLEEIFVAPPPMHVTFKTIGGGGVNANKIESYNGMRDYLIVKELVSLKYNMDYKYITPPKVYKIVGYADVINQHLTNDVVVWRTVATKLNLDPGADKSKILPECKNTLIKLSKRKQNKLVRDILFVKSQKRVYLVADAKNFIFGYCTIDDTLLCKSPVVKESAAAGYTWMMADHDTKFINVKYFKTPSVASFNHKVIGRMEMYKLQLNRLICDDSERVVVSNLPVRMRLVASRLSKSNLSSLIVMLMDKLHLVHFNDNVDLFMNTMKTLEALLDRMDQHGGGGSISQKNSLPKKRTAAAAAAAQHADAHDEDDDEDDQVAVSAAAASSPIPHGNDQGGSMAEQHDDEDYAASSTSKVAAMDDADSEYGHGGSAEKRQRIK